MFVDAMVYAFEAGSIMARSQETLTAVFAGALAADAGRLRPRCPSWARLRHPVRLAHVLCGGAGETLAKDLFGAIRSEAARRQDPAHAGGGGEVEGAVRAVHHAPRSATPPRRPATSWTPC